MSQVEAERKEAMTVEFLKFVEACSFPCLGAKAALNAGSFSMHVYERLATEAVSAQLGEDLETFLNAESTAAQKFATFIAIFEGPLALSEERFETLLWSQLQMLHQLDAARHSWDPGVSSDPADPRFSFSFAGEALYVVGMHGNSSRRARRFRWPALIFNPHRQFERLRTNGQWRRLQATIRKRDVALQGSVNPMLRDFGDRSEASQYSGRATPDDWQAPFHSASAKPAAGKCPFGH